MNDRPNALRTGAALALALALAFATPAMASAASEPQQGAQVLSEVQAGKLQRSRLTNTQYRRVGQYLMGRALGSAPRYETMDSLMDHVMGRSSSDQMYLYMGKRYLGRSVSPNSSYAPYYGWMASMMSRYGGSWAGIMGGYMMGAYRSLGGPGAAPYAGMMSGDAGGSGSSAPDNGASQYPLGPGMMNHDYGTSASSSSGGWPAAAILAVALLGVLVLVGAGLYLWPRLRGGRGSRKPAAGHS